MKPWRLLILFTMLPLASSRDCEKYKVPRSPQGGLELALFNTCEREAQVLEAKVQFHPPNDKTSGWGLSLDVYKMEVRPTTGTWLAAVKIKAATSQGGNETVFILCGGGNKQRSNLWTGPTTNLTHPRSLVIQVGSSWVKVVGTTGDQMRVPLSVNCTRPLQVFPLIRLQAKCDADTTSDCGFVSQRCNTCDSGNKYAKRVEDEGNEDSGEQGQKQQQEPQQICVGLVPFIVIIVVLALLLVTAVISCCAYRKRALNAENKSHQDQELENRGPNKYSLGNLTRCDSENSLYESIGVIGGQAQAYHTGT